MKTDLTIVMNLDELQDGVKFNGRSPVQHCGVCNHICQHPNDLGEFTHCLNKTNIDAWDKYIAYVLSKAASKIEKMDFLPTIVLDEEYEMGSKTIDYTAYQETWDIISPIWKSYNCFLISGETGIGKSVFLNKVIRDLCLHMLYDDSGKDGSRYLPIYINCSEIPTSTINIYEWILEKISSEFPNMDFNAAISSRLYTAVFFLDSFSSISFSCNEERDLKIKANLWVKNLADVAVGNPLVKFVITSENVPCLVGIDSCFKKNMDLVQLYLQPLTNPQVAMMIDMADIGEHEKQRLRTFVNSNSDLPFLKLPFFIDRLIKSVRTLEQFSSRASFVSYYIKWSSIDSTCDESMMCDFLENIAFLLCKNNHITIKDIESANLSFPRRNLMELIENSTNKMILLRSNGGFAFSHKTFFDYFLALYIKNNIWKPEIALDSILLCDMRFQNSEVLSYLYELVDDPKNFIKWLSNQDIIYAAECVSYSSCADKNYIIEKLISELTFFSSKYSDSEKKDIGVLLGKLGDKRIVDSSVASYIEPRLSTVKLSSGIQVALFPVTNLEYELFLIDPSHLDEVFWEEAIRDNWFSKDAIFNSVHSHWQKIQHILKNNPDYVENLCSIKNFDKKQCASLFYFLNLSEDELANMIKELYDHNSPEPLMRENPNYNNPSMPVVGVSVYEALAYCRWLSKKTSKHYRLLTNEEWEEAANSSFRKYSYGNRPNFKYMNTTESSWQGLLPVGVIKENQTKTGIFDISGNLFEWTSTIYPIGTSHIGLDTQYICKGGSWVQDQSRAVSSYVGRGKCWVKNIDLGFRICKDD